MQAVFEGPEHPEDDANYYRKLAARDRFQRLVVKVMADANVQALCYPTVQVLPPKKDDVRAGKTNTLTFPTNTLIASQTWMPSICVPGASRNPVCRSEWNWSCSLTTSLTCFGSVSHLNEHRVRGGRRSGCVVVASEGIAAGKTCPSPMRCQ